MSRFLDKILGPRVPPHEVRRRRRRYLAPVVLFWFARLALLVSIFLPYWHMKLEAPQYPDGLRVKAYVDHLTGDVREIDGLNHYIGMRPLNEAAQLERSLAVAAIIALMLMVEATIVVHTWWAALLALPALLFPVFFLADLAMWLSHFGQNLDPAAPLSGAIEPFTPPVLGVGMVGQFRTIAYAGPGLYLAVVASFLLVVGLYFHRRAYKPLVDARQGVADRDDSAQRFCAPGRVACAALALVALGAAARAAMGAGTGTGAGEFDLHAAIAAAAPGAIVAVPPGVYQGPVVIDRPLTLSGAAGAVIDGGGGGDVVRLEAADVTLRGFLIRNTGISLDRENAGIVALAPRAVIEGNVVEDVLFGIYLKGAPDSVIRGNTIGGKDLPVQRRGDGLRLWQSDRTIIEDNTIRDSRDAVLWYSQGLVLRRNHIVRGRYGLHFMYSHDNLLEDNLLEKNSVGAFLMYSQNLILRRNVLAYNRGPSGYGVGLKDMDGAVIEDNLVVGNRVGIHIDNSPQSLRVRQTLTRNVLAYNDIGVAFMPAVKRNDFRDNTFLDNVEQVAILGSGNFSGNNFTVEGRGNFWSDYRGYDADGDGIGDLPHRGTSLFENLMDREPSLRLFLFSPAQQAIDLAARAFPVMAPQPKFEDEAPLMAQVPIDVALPPPPGAWRVLSLAAALLGAALVLLIVGQAPLAAATHRTSVEGRT